MEIRNYSKADESSLLTYLSMRETSGVITMG